MPNLSLLRQLRASPQSDALAGLYVRHYRMVYSICLEAIGDHDRAEDAAHDVFVELIRNAGSIKEESVVPWLRRTAGNVAGNHWRKVERRADHDSQIRARCNAPVEREPKSSEDQVRMGAAMAKLAEADRRILLLHYDQDLTVQEVANTEKITPRAAKGRIASARARLRDAFHALAQSAPSLLLLQFLGLGVPVKSGGAALLRRSWPPVPKLLAFAAIVAALSTAAAVAVHQTSRVAAPPPASFVQTPPVLSPQLTSTFPPPPRDRPRYRLTSRGSSLEGTIEIMNLISERRGDVPIVADWKILAAAGIDPNESTPLDIDAGTLSEQLEQVLSQFMSSGKLRAVVEKDRIRIEIAPDAAAQGPTNDRAHTANDH